MFHSKQKLEKALLKLVLPERKGDVVEFNVAKHLLVDGM